ncbi:Terminase small subunit [compost metagenome]
MERTRTKKSVPVIEEKPEPEIPDEEGLTPKQRIFVMEYLRDFNATRAAKVAEKTAYSIGWGRFKCSACTDGVHEIAFADITDYVEFGQRKRMFLA